MLSVQALQPCYEPFKRAVITRFAYIQESARTFASAAEPYLEEMKEFSCTFLKEKSGILNSWLSTVSEMQDHQLIMLCIIFFMICLTSLLKLLQFLSYLPSAQSISDASDNSEQGNLKEVLNGKRGEDTPKEDVKSSYMCPGHAHFIKRRKEERVAIDGSQD
jgi:hypothetical protein